MLVGIRSGKVTGIDQLPMEAQRNDCVHNFHKLCDVCFEKHTTALLVLNMQT